MKKSILIYSHIKNTVDSHFLSSLLIMLSNNRFTIYVITNKKFKPTCKNNCIIFIKNTTRITYDIILAINKGGYALINEKVNKPILYCVNSRYYYESFGVKIKYNQLIVYDRSNDIRLNDSSTLLINTPFQYTNFSCYIQYNETLTDYLISVEEFETMLQVGYVFNQLVDKSIELHFPINVDTESFFNPNIVLSKENEDIVNSIYKSNLFIGEGQAVIMAILMLKPVIIVGNKGYGGIVNENNIYNHYKSGFSGRLGGVRGEDIPANLLLFDIFEYSKYYKKATLINIKNNLIELLSFESTKFLKVINYFVINQYNFFEKTKIKRNPDYELLLMKKSNEYFLKHKITNKFWGTLKPEEMKIINSLSFPDYLYNIYKQFILDFQDCKYKTFEQIIKELIDCRVLIYDI